MTRFPAPAVMVSLVALLPRPAAVAPDGPPGIFEAHGDVGPVAHPGSVAYDATAGTYTVRGGGENMWFSTDAFHFVWKKGHDRVKGQGFRLYCGTTQSVDALAEAIKTRGVTLLEEPKDQPWGGREFAVVDPDGFVISIGSE